MQRDMLKKELAALILSGLVFVCATWAFWWYNIKAIAADPDVSALYLVCSYLFWYCACLATGILVLWNGKWPMDKQQVVLGGVLGFAAVAFGIIGFAQGPEIGQNVTVAFGLIGVGATLVRIWLTLLILKNTPITTPFSGVKKDATGWRGKR